MNRFLLFLLNLIFAFNTFGQNGQNDFTEDRKARSTFTSIPLPDKNVIRDQENLSSAILTTLFNHFILTETPDVIFKPVNQKESQGGFHLTYEQYFNGLPLYGAQVKVNLNKEAIIRSVFDNSFDAAKWDKNKIESQKNISAGQNSVSTFIDINFPAGIEYSYRKIIFVNPASNEPQVAFQLTVISKNSNLNREILLDLAGKILFQRDLNIYFRLTDSIVSAKVFLPDPLTSAQVYYGGQYKDFDNSDVPELNNQRKTVSMTVNFSNDTFYLESPYVKIEDFAPPSFLPVNSSVPVFNFTRQQSGFEDVNAYYHINVFQQYIQSIGINNLNTLISVDAHGSTDDLSYFIPGGLKINFGTGGVDDAEDADVIIHEYGHALSFFANNSNFGNERKALDEAFGDYVAASYSRGINAFDWENIFNWDAHNEFWSGRTVTNPGHYPEDAGTSIYTMGELFSSTLLQIWTELGKTVTDKLVFEALYSFSSNMTLKDAAKLIVQADTALYAGTNFITLYKYFVMRGLMDSITCSSMNPPLIAHAGNDTTIFFNHSLLLGNSMNISGGTPPFTYFWSPDDYLACQNCDTNTIYPSSDITYQLTVVDSKGCFAHDFISIYLACENCVALTDSTIYTGFSPNNDGKNDFWKIPMFDFYKENEVHIFNRWGGEVWSTQNYDNQHNFWSGKNLKGHQLPDGTYFYYIRYHEEKIKGWVIIKRE